MVLDPTTLREKEDAEYLAREFRDFPIVVVDLYQPSMRRPHLIFDNEEAGYQMTRRLFEQGHRQFAFLKFSDAIPYRSVDDRLLGHQRALEDLGLTFQRERVIAFEGKGTMTKEHIEALERVLALSPRPTALITPQDPYAEASIAWLRDQGISEEMVVAGFDNLQHRPWGEPNPTTCPDFVRMGQRAAEMLLDRSVGQGKLETEIVLPCPLSIPAVTTQKEAGSSPLSLPQGTVEPLNRASAHPDECRG